MFEEKMILQADKTERLTERLNWSPQMFADAINIEIKEAYKLLISRIRATRKRARACSARVG
ncbi:hypothetical protein FACS1894211_14640 [Clostridia bacterium]|nr:hypothetical protein FACS1894211_14640 [Clostridia bacterium]